MEEKQEYLRRIYAMAIMRGLCKSQKEFAGLIPVNDKGFSAAINGNPKFLTPNLVNKVQAFAIREGLESAPEPIKQETIEVPVAFKEMLDNLSAVLRTQADMLAVYQSREMSASSTSAGGKNFSPNLK